MFPDSFDELLSAIMVCQALGFAIIFIGIYHNARRYPKKYMSWFMLASAGYFGVTWLNGSAHFPTLRYVYPLTMPLLLCHLPIFYWYLCSLTDSRFRVNNRQLLHLVPALAILILELPYYLLPEQETMRFIKRDLLNGSYDSMRKYIVGINHIAFYLVFTAQFIFYIVKYRLILQAHRNRMEDVYSFKDKIDFRWLRTLMIVILIFFIGNDIAYILLNDYQIFSATFFSLGMISINFFIGYHTLMQSAVFNTVSVNSLAQQSLENENIINTLGITKFPVEREEEIHKYKRSSLTTEARETIIRELTSLMQEEEIYTEPQLSIDQVAAKLNVNSKYLSQAINEVYHQNFYNYINELRVEKAKNFMQKNSHGHFSVEGIASQVGFQSKSSFYSAFKKSTGVTPAAFRAKVKE